MSVTDGQTDSIYMYCAVRKSVAYDKRVN